MPFQHPLPHPPDSLTCVFPPSLPIPQAQHIALLLAEHLLCQQWAGEGAVMALAMTPSGYREPHEGAEGPEIPPHQQESNPYLPFQKSAFTELIIITLYYKDVFTWNKSLQTQETISRAQLRARAPPLVYGRA